MTKYHFSDIPDELITKEYFPMGRHLWRIFSELGPRFLMKWHMKYTNSIDELMKDRLDSAIKIGKAFIEDRLEDPKKTLSFQFFPTFSMIRSDLQSGAMRQLFSESADCTFVMIDDTMQEIFFLINTHIEEGFPTNWWIIGRDDEILNSKHKKFDFTIRNLPKKLKDLNKVGMNLLDTLKDVRNERDPSYTQSSFHMAVSYASNVANLIMELSSYEGFNALWEGFQLKSKYPHLKDSYATYLPNPTFLKTLFYRGRNEYTIQMNRLMLESRLALHTVEEKWQNFIKDELPELWEVGLISQLKEGIPTPRLSLLSKSPNIGDPEIKKAEKFDFIYPEGERITPEKLELSEEEFFSGVYLNVTDNTPVNEKITKSHIISTGLGKETKIY